MKFLAPDFWSSGRARLRAAGALLLSLCLALPVLADPPGRAGRVASLSGQAWIYDSQERQWQALLPNQTVGDGDRLRTDVNSRLALRVGSTSLWLDQAAEIEFSALTDARVSVQLLRGALGLRLRNQDAVDEWSVATLEGRSWFERQGLYRLAQLPRATQAQAWQGRLRFESRFFSPGGSAQPLWLSTNEQAELWSDGSGPRAERQALMRDGFADWLLASSRAEGDPQLAHVSPEMTGAEELDRYGEWAQSEEHGVVWIPRQVAVDWVPYSQGRWVWSRHWGWTWVDEMPWGFAPFHYGRWVMWRDRWCWSPGPWVARPVYAPALVAWSGPGVSVNLFLGRHAPPPRYGWAPLPWHEPYRPPYRYSPDYWRRINPDPVTVRPAPMPPTPAPRPWPRDGAQPGLGQRPDGPPVRVERPRSELPAAPIAQPGGAVGPGLPRRDSEPPVRAQPMPMPDAGARRDELPRRRHAERPDVPDRMDRFERPPRAEAVPPVRSEPPRMEPPRMEAPRMEPPRREAPRMEAPPRMEVPRPSPGPGAEPRRESRPEPGRAEVNRPPVRDDGPRRQVER